VLRKKALNKNMNEKRNDIENADIVPHLEDVKRAEEKTMAELETISQIVGGDFGMKVSEGEEGEGSYFSPSENKIVFDPLVIKNDPDYAKYVAGHEGSHRAISAGAKELGLTKAQEQEFFGNVGFRYLNNAVEDPAVNTWLKGRFPGFEPLVNKKYDKELESDDPNSGMVSPEVARLAEQTGKMPLFAQYGTEVMRDWHKGVVSEKVDPAVKKALDRTIDDARENIKNIPNSASHSRQEKTESAQKRFEKNVNYLWPEVKKLVEKDLHNEELHNSANDYEKMEEEMEKMEKQEKQQQEQRGNSSEQQQKQSEKQEQQSEQQGQQPEQQGQQGDSSDSQSNKSEGQQGNSSGQESGQPSNDQSEKSGQPSDGSESSQQGSQSGKPEQQSGNSSGTESGEGWEQPGSPSDGQQGSQSGKHSSVRQSADSGMTREQIQKKLDETGRIPKEFREELKQKMNEAKEKAEKTLREAIEKKEKELAEASGGKNEDGGEKDGDSKNENGNETQDSADKESSGSKSEKTESSKNGEGAEEKGAENEKSSQPSGSEKNGSNDGEEESKESKNGSGGGGSENEENQEQKDENQSAKGEGLENKKGSTSEEAESSESENDDKNSSDGKSGKNSDEQNVPDGVTNPVRQPSEGEETKNEKKEINEALSEKIKQEIEKLKNELEKMQSGEKMKPLPLDELSEELKNELEKQLTKRPKEEREKYKENAKRAMEEFEDALNEELEAKLSEDVPESHEERRERMEKEAKSGNQTQNTASARSSEMTRKEINTNQINAETLKVHLTQYEKMRKDVAPLADALYLRLVNHILKPEDYGNDETGYSTGLWPDFTKVMQAEHSKDERSKLWFRETFPGKKDYYFAHLFDASESMNHGGKMTETMKGGIVVIEPIDRMQDLDPSKITVRQSVAAFNNRYFPIKSTEERMTKKVEKDFASIVSLPKQDDAGTNTFKALEITLAELLKNPGENGSFVLVYTDGAPNGGIRAKLKTLLKGGKSERKKLNIKIGIIWLGQTDDEEEMKELKDEYGFDFGVAMTAVKPSEEDRREGKKNFAEKLGGLLESIVENPDKY